jgi:hypothetical protein
MANEIEWVGSGGFGDTADTSSINTPPPPAPQGWGDLGMDVAKLGAGSVVGQLGAGARYAGYEFGSPSIQNFGDYLTQKGEDISGSISPGGKEITDAPIFSSETLQHPFAKTTMGVAKAGLWNVPALITGGEGYGAMAARAAIGGALGVTGAYSGVVDSINAQPDDQLQKASPTYMEIRKTHPEYEAKQILANQAWSSINPAEKAAIIGTSALAGEAGPLTTVGKAVTGVGGSSLARLASGRIGQAVIGAAETGGVQAGQYAGTAIPTRDALASVGAPTDTNEQIARNTAEQFGLGAVIGGGTRFIKPQGGKNESRSDTRGVDAWDRNNYMHPRDPITVVQAGAPDPAQAQALKSTTQPISGDQQATPPRTGPMQYPDHPFPTAPTVWPGMGEDANKPPPPTPPPGPEPHPAPVPAPVRPPEPVGQAPIPARPTPQPVRQGELPLTYERPNVPRQGEMPLQAPQPQRPAPEQGTLDLQRAPQPVVQRGLPGMGTDVTHEKAAPLVRSPDQDSPPAQYELQLNKYGMPKSLLKKKETPAAEPTEQPTAPVTEKPTAAKGTALKRGKAAAAKEEPVTTDSEAGLGPATKKWLASEDETPATKDDTAARAASMAEREKAAGQVAANAAVARGKPVIPRKTQGTFDTSKLGEKTEAPTAKTKLVQAAQAVAAKIKGTFDTSKLKAEGTTEGEQPKLTRTQAKQAAIEARLTKLTTDKFQNLLVHGKIKKASVDDIMAAGEARKQPIYQHPTTKEYYVNTPTKVTVVPPSDARLGGIKPGAAAIKAAAEAVARVREKALEKQEAKVDRVDRTEPVGPKGTKLKSLKDLGKAVAEKEGGTSDILQRTIKAFDEDKDEGEGESNLDKHFKDEKPYPVLSREEGGPLIESGRLRPAGLYEPDQAPKGTRFVHVNLGGGLKRLYRVMDKGEDLDKHFKDEKSIEDAKAQVHPNPTEPQVDAGNFKQGHPPASATQGQTVTIHSAEGEHGQAEGHILGTADNIPAEHLDTLIHSSNDTGVIHVVNELDNNTSQFIRHVAVQGAANIKEAINTFAAAYKKKYGEFKGIIGEGVVPMTPEEFKHFKQTRNPNEPVYPSTEGKHPLGYVDTMAGKFKTQGSSTLKTALEDALRKVPNTFKYALYRKLADQVIKYLPDVPVYYLSKEDFDKIDPDAYAVYNAMRNHILIGGDQGPHPELTLLHEALHAATAHLYTINRLFKARVDKLLKEYKQGIPGLGNVILSHNIKAGGGAELLAELARPNIQGDLANIQMSHDLAKELNMEGWAKGTQTLWGGFVKSFMDALHTINIHLLGADDTSKFTLLDGLLRLNDEAFVTRSSRARTDFANMVRASKEFNEGTFADRKEAEHNSQENIYNTIHDAVSNPEALGRHYYSDAKSLSDRASDLIDKLPKGTLKKKAYDWIVPFKGSDALRMDTEHLWGEKTEANPERRWGETNLRRDGYLTSLIAKVNNTIHDMYSEYRGHTKAETEHLADTMAQATAYRVDPRSPIGEGNNAWLKSPGWQWRNEAQQALANYDRIVKMYNDIHPGLKPRFSKLADEYHAAGLERAKLAANELIDSITNAGQKFLTPLKVIDPKDVKLRDRQEYINFHNDWETNWEQNKEKLRDQLLKGNLGENEEQWLSERGFDDVSDIDKLANPRGLYIPLDHAGQFGINGEYKIEKPTNGTQVAGKDNAFDFKTEADAEAFYNKQPPNSRMIPVYFNDEGKEASRWDTWQKPDGSVGFAKDNKAYRVEVNNKYYSGHDGISSANRRYAQLKASGAFSKLSLPQTKRSGWYQGLPVSSPLFNHLMAAVDKRTDYTNAQKEAVKGLLRDTALSSLEGNRIAKHMMERKAVAGWDTDYIKTFKSYMDAHNALISRVKYSKDMNSAVNDMMKYADEHQGEEGATERGYVLDELNKRDNFFGTPNDQGEGKGGFAGRVLKFAEAASFFAHMVSPGHLITHQTHQILTYDVLAAKYGPLKAAAMAGRMHSIMAGTGFRNVMRSIPEMIRIITKDSKGLNYVEGLMDKMGQHPKYGADLTRMLNEAIATNRLHPDQGFDASVLHMGSGKLERGLARLDLASRQMMGSTEAYSRVWGYSLGYALARDAGETHEQAMRTAFDTVSRTQGLLSRSNMSSVMNKWYMRSPMQFRGWGINQMVSLANSVYNVFKPDAPGVRAEAVRRLLYLFGSTAALTGINGLPSDPMRVGLALAGALGLTNYNWSDAQNKMREFFAKETSPGMANFLMDGAVASLGPFSFFGGDRIGFGSLAVFGEPQSYSKGDISAWLLQIMGGAPFGEISPMTIGEGIKALQEGDYAKATQVFVPLKLVSDWAKAWQGMYKGFPTKTGAPGMEPYSAGETFMQSLGLTPARKERFREASEAEYRAEQATRTEHSELLNALGTATTEPDRMKARMQIAAFNLRNPDARITPQDVMRAARRQTAPSGLGKTLYRGNRERIQSLQNYYNAY